MGTDLGKFTTGYGLRYNLFLQQTRVLYNGEALGLLFEAQSAEGKDKRLLFEIPFDLVITANLGNITIVHLNAEFIEKCKCKFKELLFYEILEEKHTIVLGKEKLALLNN